MATDGKVNRWNGVAYSAADERLLDTPLLMPGAASAPFSGRSGRRVNNTGLAVTFSSTGNGSATVGAGAGVIYDSGYASQGPWRFEIPASVGPIALGARPSVGQSRIDLVIARIYDQDIPLGAVREVKIEVVAGTPGASPSAPSLPALSVLLGTLTVPNAGAISLISSTAVVVAAGGILPVATSAERDALEADGIAYRGLVVDNAQTDALERYDGTDWKTLVESDDTAWAPLTLGNSWVAFGGAYDIPSVRHVSGLVCLKGSMKSGTEDTTVATLPAGNRPGATRRYLVSSGPGTGSATVDITTAGVISVVNYIGAGANSLVTLDNIPPFPPEA